MEVLLSFILSVQVGLSVFAYMLFNQNKKDSAKTLQSYIESNLSAQAELDAATPEIMRLRLAVEQFQKDLTIVKAKLALGTK